MTTDDVSALKSSPMPQSLQNDGLHEQIFSFTGTNEAAMLNAYSRTLGKLRLTAAEALLAGALVLADVQRDPNWKEQITKDSEQRFRKALEELARALG